MTLAFHQDFLPKLQRHLLERIIQGLRTDPSDPQDVQDADCSHILFRSDRLYRHNIMRLNFTTYDVRRSQDVVNAYSSHCNVMVLNNRRRTQENDTHPYRYARVLGIYHANVVYNGPGMITYQPRRMETLWVRWYDRLEVPSGWDARRLDRIQFTPMNDDNAFGFVDPSDILRGCHIIPAFRYGKRHLDGKGLSTCAQDSSDWVSYYVNRYLRSPTMFMIRNLTFSGRFVDRDMLMRYYFGHGIGHTYTRGSSSSWSFEPPSTLQELLEEENMFPVANFTNVDEAADGDAGMLSTEDDSMSDDFQDTGCYESHDDLLDDQELVEMDEMYAD